AWAAPAGFGPEAAFIERVSANGLGLEVAPLGDDLPLVPAPPLLASAPPRKVHTLAALTQLHQQAADPGGPPGAASSRSARGRHDPRALGSLLEGPQTARLPPGALGAGQLASGHEEAELTGPAPPAPTPAAPPPPREESWRQPGRSVRLEMDVRQMAPPSAELESLLTRPKRSAAGTGCDSQESRFRVDASNERLPQLLEGLQVCPEAQPSPRRDNVRRVDKGSASSVLGRVRNSLESNYGSLNVAWRHIEAA
ncbi:unnamed protein product, partial [Prorocentrum cordatum]